jgi:hypothetical protein
MVIQPLPLDMVATVYPGRKYLLGALQWRQRSHRMPTAGHDARATSAALMWPRTSSQALLAVVPLHRMTILRRFPPDVGTGRFSSGSLPWLLSMFAAKGIEFDDIWGGPSSAGTANRLPPCAA